MGGYVKKTDRRRDEDRSFSVRAVHRDPADLHKLAEVLIRLTLQETGRSRADRRATEPPETYRDPAAAIRSAASAAGPLLESHQQASRTRGVVVPNLTRAGGQHAP